MLGSTGSIGTQALDVIAARPQRFRVVGLAAGGTDVALLAAQAAAHGVRRVAVADPAAAAALRRELPGVDVLAGPDAATELTATTPADTVLNGITGSRGLGPTLAALATGATLALANKESLVAGGPLVTAAARARPDRPGRLRALRARPVPARRPRATRSRGWCSPPPAARSAGGGATSWPTSPPEQALAHPTWDMGPVVTINSATLVNKGLEVIEAHLLFGVPYDRIDVVVHPQSVVHSMVDVRRRLDDRAGQPAGHAAADRAGAGLAGPGAGRGAGRARGTPPQAWTFEPLDDDAFPGVRLARHAGEAGGCLPAVFNAANEEAVAAFVAGGLRFPDLTAVVEDTLAAADGWRTDPATPADVAAAEDWARAHARERVAAAAS